MALYLTQMERLRTQRPFLMFIGEAPGYRGCLQTGVPFTSEAIIRDGIAPWNLFGAQNGYQISSIKPQKEATATMMWQILENGRCVPLLWNAFPFHPHKPARLDSNRTPTQQEMITGTSFTTALIEQFNPQKIVAVGSSAHKALTIGSIPHEKVRHPSHGGKKAFAAGIEQILTQTDS